MANTSLPKAVLFDLLTALLDSWTVWNAAAGSETQGRAWRTEYLRLTYGCGAYVPYEDLVATAAATVGLPPDSPRALEEHWTELPVWSGVQAALDEIEGQTKLAIVTNCSRRLGVLAANRLNTRWDCIVTAEDAGFYKPDPRPYRHALQELQVAPEHAAFVAGSGYDLFGTAAVGLRTYWHNRVGLARPDGAPAADIESPTFEGVVSWLKGFA
ncbi:HAD-IA family hydrolase [Bradyrhizobium prioriisuperbiae]|uniref:HAD-IA family hydrolase n=1 Tax=Bradyrhizobium prioriisuperbiae TaxID=2854389 RepID=UPI0028F0AD26|nr:HAD-IA family hydrolase [Bradyrhizobium prioritasuperba]